MDIHMVVPVTVDEIHTVDALPPNWGKMKEWERVDWVSRNSTHVLISGPKYNGENIEITSIKEEV